MIALIDEARHSSTDSPQSCEMKRTFQRYRNLTTSALLDILWAMMMSWDGRWWLKCVSYEQWATHFLLCCDFNCVYVTICGFVLNAQNIKSNYKSSHMSQEWNSKWANACGKETEREREVAKETMSNITNKCLLCTHMFRPILSNKLYYIVC